MCAVLVTPLTVTVNLWQPLSVAVMAKSLVFPRAHVLLACWFLTADHPTLVRCVVKPPVPAAVELHHRRQQQQQDCQPHHRQHISCSSKFLNQHRFPSRHQQETRHQDTKQTQQLRFKAPTSAQLIPAVDVSNTSALLCRAVLLQPSTSSGSDSTS